jgi:hypothetical protein
MKTLFQDMPQLSYFSEKSLKMTEIKASMVGHVSVCLQTRCGGGQS